VSTFRERHAARAARLRAWAEKREADAKAALATGEHYRGDIAFATQPGHIPERARLIAREDRAFASLNVAAEMRARAEGIERADGRAIYADDPDAIPRLEERIAKLEAERERCKTANAEYRKAHRAELAAMTPYQRSQGVLYPGYHLESLGARIREAQSRLAALRRRP
jgi:hypothetical protein